MVIAAAFWKLLGLFVKITSEEGWDVAELKHALTFIRLVKSKVWQLFQFFEPVSKLKSPATKMFPNFVRSWFADWVTSSKNSFRLLLLGGLKANKIPHFLL